MSNTLRGKVVLITGGTGSFGRKLAKKLVKLDCCEKVIIFSRDEWKQWEMQQSGPLLRHPAMRYFLGDVRDLSRLERAFNGVDIVIHAAALKQVPAAEYNPSEFIKTNIQGSMNVIDAAINSGVKKVIALSTDKAVNPVNLYGATKLCADKLFVAGNAYVGKRGYPRLSVVRYGNVANSRGSIVEQWRKKLAEGAKAITITDKRMTRFWITQEQAVDFVLQSLEVMKGGEIFVPKIPSIRIVELAEAIAPGMPHEICGIRAGEKLHELLISIEDARHTREYENYYTIYPEIISHSPAQQKFHNSTGAPLAEGFCYTSENNGEWLSIEQLQQLLSKSV